MAIIAAGSGAAAALVVAGDPATESAPVAVAPVVMEADESGELSVGEIVDLVGDSVVSIETVVETRRGPFSGQSVGVGTGVVLDDGYIITNAHVISGATTVEITVPSTGEVRRADVVGAVDSADVAVLRVGDPSGLVPATIAIEQPEVGDDVVAIGNALALEGGLTVTSGIVSALDRSIGTVNGELGDLVQTDAAISSGNSGGALVNDAGELIGINTAVATSGGGVAASNIGFAISIDRALDVAASILAGA